MSEVGEWCAANVEKIKELVGTLESGRPDREVRPPIHQNEDLLRISGEIEGDLNTLRYIRKNKSALSDLKDLIEGGRTPDFGYFGPAPNLSLGDPGGMGAAFGLAADLGGAVMAVLKGARADKKLRKEVRADPSGIKQVMVKQYCDLVLLLQVLVEHAAASEEFAKKVNKAGLNVPILNRTWRTVRNNTWLVLAG